MTCKAYVINTDTGELSQWLEVGFSRVWMLNGEAYMVRPDGVYKMDAALETPSMVASIQTTPDRLGTEQAKRLLFVMSDGVGDVSITPIYDGVVSQTYEGVVGSDRGIKVGRGNKSRWAALKIDSSSRGFVVNALRFYFEALSRRAK